jgi:hypothetical protein
MYSTKNQSCSFGSLWNTLESPIQSLLYLETQLFSLDLNSNTLAVTDLSRALSTNTTLKSLNLARNGILDREMSILSQAIKSNPRSALEIINLDMSIFCT